MARDTVWSALPAEKHRNIGNLALDAFLFPSCYSPTRLDAVRCLNGHVTCAVAALPCKWTEDTTWTTTGGYLEGRWYSSCTPRGASTCRWFMNHGQISSVRVSHTPLHRVKQNGGNLTLSRNSGSFQWAAYLACDVVSA